MTLSEFVSKVQSGEIDFDLYSPNFPPHLTWDSCWCEYCVMRRAWRDARPEERVAVLLGAK